MSVLPRRSPGVISAPLSGSTVVYDLVTETRHRLDPGSGTVFWACDGRTDRDTAIIDWAHGAGIDRSVVADRVEATLTRLGELGLVGRATPWTPPMPRPGAEPDDDAPHRGDGHRVLDRTIRFVGDDEALLRRIDDYLGTAHTATPSTDGTAPGGSTPEATSDEVVFRVQWLPGGEVRLVTDVVADHADLATLLPRLVTVVNEYAVATHGCLGLHAGAVRSPDGHIVVLPGVSGPGSRR